MNGSSALQAPKRGRAYGREATTQRSKYTLSVDEEAGGLSDGSSMFYEG